MYSWLVEELSTRKTPFGWKRRLWGGALTAGRSAADLLANASSKAGRAAVGALAVASRPFKDGAAKRNGGELAECQSRLQTPSQPADSHKDEGNLALGMAKLLAAVGKKQGLTLQLPHWLDLTVGTSNGLRVLFAKSEVQGNTQRTSSPAKADDGPMARLLRKTTGSIAAARHQLKQANAKVATVFVRVSGAGFAIPRACVGLALSRSASGNVISGEVAADFVEDAMDD